MKEKKKLSIFIVFFAGILLSTMAAMMRIGGNVNLKEFMSAGRVYDFSQATFKKNSDTWLYLPEENGYQLISSKASKGFKISGKIQTWEYLYINVDKLSQPSVNAVIVYNAKDRSKIAEQPVELTEGQNIVLLNPTIPMYRLSIKILDAEGAFISISSMQIRTTPSWYTPQHFLKLFFAAFAVFLAVVIPFLYIRKKYFGKRKKKWRYNGLLDILQDSFQLAGNYFGKQVGGKLSEGQRESFRKFFFCLLFAWMFTGNVLNWISNGEMYRYHVLGCVLMILAISFVSWEKPLKKISWENPLIVSWLILWLGVAASDFLVVVDWGMTGGVMLLAGSFFFFFWQNMEHPYRMIQNILTALEFTFLVGTVYCMIFRMKKPAVDYNGLFRSPEESAMYAVLMLCVFLVEMDEFIKKEVRVSEKVREFWEKRELYVVFTKNITGLAVSLYFVWRSKCIPGYAAVGIIGLLFIWRQIKRFITIRSCWILFLRYAAAGIAALVVVCILHISTKYLPEKLGTDVNYEQELLLTGLSDDMWETFLIVNPDAADGVRQKEDMEIPVIWRNYVRRWNLLGNTAGIWVFREKVPAYSGYINIAYQSGIFILLPYVVYQITMIGTALKKSRQEEKGRVRGNGGFWCLLTGVSYLCFCFFGNVDVVWGHPLWLSFYLAAGYLSKDSAKESLKGNGREIEG